MRTASWFGPASLVVLTAAAAGCGVGVGGPLEATGTIEADDVRVASTVGGRVAEVLAREGERVEAGDVLLRFDTTDLELQVEQARAAVRAATATLEMARNGARAEDVAAAEEMLRQARAGEAAAAADLERVRGLVSEGAAPTKQGEDAETRHTVAASQMRAAQVQLDKVLRGARPEELEMAAAGLQQAEAALALAEQRLADCEVTAPRAGTVVHRLVEPGEVAGPGGTLMVLQDLDTVRLTVFVPEDDVGRVRLGAPVDVAIDSVPDRTFPGRVARVRQQAEFTPKNVQTRDERVKLVFGVEVELDNPEGILKPGLPADAVFRDAGAATVAQVRDAGADRGEAGGGAR